VFQCFSNHSSLKGQVSNMFPPATYTSFAMRPGLQIHSFDIQCESFSQNQKYILSYFIIFHHRFITGTFPGLLGTSLLRSLPKPSEILQRSLSAYFELLGILWNYFAMTKYFREMIFVEIEPNQGLSRFFGFLYNLNNSDNFNETLGEIPKNLHNFE